MKKKISNNLLKILLFSQHKNLILNLKYSIIIKIFQIMLKNLLINYQKYYFCLTTNLLSKTII